MMLLLVATVQWSLMAVLAVLAGRRCLLLGASLLPDRQTPRDATRRITVLVAARDEATQLPALLAGLARLDYPAHLLHLVFVDDGSQDDTRGVLQGWPHAPCPYTVMTVSGVPGKGRALDAGLTQAPPSDLVVVLDADCVPEPDVLQVLSGAFDDPRVGAATGYPRPANAHASLTARYAALERWMHHLVVLAGKDRLGLNPSIIGVVFAIRRTVLEAVGGFPVGRLAEDVELGHAVIAQGWRLRWLRHAVVRENVVEDLTRFLAQRRRWARGTLQSRRGAQSLEQFFVSVGYLDRLAVLAALVLVPFGLMPLWIPVAYLAVPAVSLLYAIHRAGEGPTALFVWAAVRMFATDVAVTVQATAGHVFGTSVPWGGRRPPDA